MVYKNGVDTLLDCANIAVKKNPKLMFVAVGKGPDLESVRRRLSSWGSKRTLGWRGL